MAAVVVAQMGKDVYDKYTSSHEDINSNHRGNMIALHIQNDSGDYELSSNNTFPTDGYVLNTEKTSCINGGTITQNPTTKVLSLSVTNTDSCNVYFDKKKELSEMTLAALKVSSNGTKTGFESPATTDEGIFEMEDDYGTSYYYRGAVTNNYVKFAGFFWRIIRINGDGSLRIIYDGTKAHANGTNDADRFTHISQKYNAKYIDAKYVGWMYGTASTSKEQAQMNTESPDIKKVVDTWYKTNIVDAGYGSAVTDVLFCNDRSIPGKDVTGYSSDTGKGFGTNATAYGAYARTGVESINYTNVRPTFKCQEKNDAFTVNDREKGNGDLTYPIGLITADEIIAAGSGKYSTTNQSYYLYRGSSYFYWSISPYFINPNGYAYVFDIHGKGNLSSSSLYGEGAVAPVINLSAEYVSNMVGDGTIGNEYRVE